MSRATPARRSIIQALGLCLLFACTLIHNAMAQHLPQSRGALPSTQLNVQLTEPVLHVARTRSPRLSTQRNQVYGAPVSRSLNSLILSLINSPQVIQLVRESSTATDPTQQPTTSAPTTTVIDTVIQENPRHLILAIELDAGIPFGVGLNLAVRPLSWLRLFVGGGYNLMAPGIRAGLSVGVPLHSAVRDIGLGIEAGHYFEGDANPLAELIVGSDPNSLSLRNFSYNYVSGVLRMELGSNVARLVIEVGVTYVHSNLQALGTDLGNLTGYDTVSVSGGTFSALLPAGKLGLAVYVW